MWSRASLRLSSFLFIPVLFCSSEECSPGENILLRRIPTLSLRQLAYLFFCLSHSAASSFQYIFSFQLLRCSSRFFFFSFQVLVRHFLYVLRNPSMLFVRFWLTQQHACECFFRQKVTYSLFMDLVLQVLPMLFHLNISLCRSVLMYIFLSRCLSVLRRPVLQLVASCVQLGLCAEMRPCEEIRTPRSPLEPCRLHPKAESVLILQ